MKIFKLINRKNFQKGSYLIELLMVIGLLAILLPALLTGFAATRGGRAQQEQRQKALALLREGQEAVRVYREADWINFDTFAKANCDNSITTTNACHPVIDSPNNTWILAPGNPTINGFKTTIIITDVNRDFITPGMPIVPTGTLDPSTKKVTVTVSWTTPTANSVNATEYLTRNDNLTHVDTLVSDFSPLPTGSESVEVKTTAGTDGEVDLIKVSSGGDWCKPDESVIGTYNLSKNGIPEDIAVPKELPQNFAYVTTGGNDAGYVVDEIKVDNIVPSVTPTISDPNYNNDNSIKAYGIYTDGSYVYYGGNKHTVQILKGSPDIPPAPTPPANPTYLPPYGYFDVKGNGNNILTGNSVYISNNIGYVTAESKLYSFKVNPSKSNPSQDPQGNIPLAGTGKKVMIVKQNAYVVTSDTSKQLQIINVSNPKNMTLSKSIKLENGSGIDVFVDSSEKYAYVTTDVASGNHNFFVIDLSNTNNIFSFTTNAGIQHPKGIILPVSNRAIIVGSGSGGELYQVFNNDDPNLDPSKWTHCGGMSPSGVSTIYGVAGVTINSNVYSYIITDNASTEFQIIRGGGGIVSNFATLGTYYSKPFDAGHDSAFNYFTSNGLSSPPTTSLIYSVAIKHGSCISTTFNPGDFKGPYLLTSGAIQALPLDISNPSGYENPGECMQYKVDFTSDGVTTPTFQDILFNYSP